MEYRAREYEMIATKLLEDSERRLVLVYRDVCIICPINTFSIMNFEKSLSKWNSHCGYFQYLQTHCK